MFNQHVETIGGKRVIKILNKDDYVDEIDILYAISITKSRNKKIYEYLLRKSDEQLEEHDLNDLSPPETLLTLRSDWLNWLKAMYKKIFTQVIYGKRQQSLHMIPLMNMRETSDWFKSSVLTYSYTILGDVMAQVLFNNVHRIIVGETQERLSVPQAKGKSSKPIQ